MDSFIQKPKEEKQAKKDAMQFENKTKTGKTRAKNTVDEELQNIIASQRARIKIIGCGGAGNNTVTRISELGVYGAKTIAINTDAQDLLYADAEEKILIGKQLTKGMGAGSIPKLGEEAALENEKEINSAAENSDLVFVTCGLGGGTGTGSIPIVAGAAKNTGALTIAIVTLPFTAEGMKRCENAINGLDKLEKNVDSLIIIPNDKLLEISPGLSMHEAFKLADTILADSVKGIIELITKVGLVNLDIADLRAVMKNSGIALIGIGESDSDNRAEESVARAINNPLLEIEISGATGALINIMGGKDLKLDEAKTIVETVTKRLDMSSRVIWGAQINDELEKTLKILLIVTGAKTGSSSTLKKIREAKKEEIEKSLGIKFY